MTAKKCPTMTRFYVDQAQLKGLRNMKPETYPAEPMNPEVLVSKAIVSAVPKRIWEGDWLINLENDINWLEDHFQAGPNDYLYIQETHRFFIKDGKVNVEFKDGTKKLTPILEHEVRFIDRWLPPIGMLKLAARFVLRVKEIGVKWADEKKTELVWIVGIERAANPDALLLEL